jgi:hypothetical protein
MFRSAGDCLAVVETFKARGVSLFLLDRYSPGSPGMISPA